MARMLASAEHGRTSNKTARTDAAWRQREVNVAGWPSRWQTRWGGHSLPTVPLQQVRRKPRQVLEIAMGNGTTTTVTVVPPGVSGLVGTFEPVAPAPTEW